MQERAGTAKHKRRVVEARQANHNSYLLPDILEGYEEKALYRYVARWSFIRGKYICCDDVAENFGISMRLATNIISMIHRRYGDVISYKIKRTKSGKGNVIKTHLLVTDIKCLPRSKPKPRNRSIVENCTDAKIKNLRDTFLFNRKGNSTTAGI